MAVTSIAELKAKIQTLSGNKRENLRDSTYLSTIATELQTEIADLELATADADLISQAKKYLTKVQTQYTGSIS
jgi:hypothetical protein|tara:strand:+ start:1584 stop:1805 length:222 start_codon:yes stop_codon:yes gene_type:complete